MSGIEAAIDTALETVSPAEMQQLAEGYAELRWPGRYGHLVPQGRNAFNSSTSGWPDAWSRADECGSVHAVEATNGQWSTHLRSDIEKAKSFQGQLATFVFVCRDNQPEAGPGTTLESLTQDLRGLCLEEFSLVFRQELTKALAHPRFARLRSEVLNLPVSPSPFAAIDEALLYSDGTSIGFAPTKAEFAIPGGVWRHEARSKITTTLDSRGWAYIEGHGAAGKTVLCTGYALEWAGARRPAYYLDLGRDLAGMTGPAIDAMVRYSGEDVLFIVDNVHGDEAAAAALFGAWEQSGGGSRLVLCGRHVSPGQHPGLGDRLAAIRADPIHVRATPMDVRGVYRRLARRVVDLPPEPGSFLNRKWARLFDGDLVAFAAAVSAKLSRGEMLPDLSPNDGVELARRRYLHEHQPTAVQLDALTLVAALGVIELATPRELVDPGLLTAWRSGGEIVDVADGVTVSHAGVARLLMAALERPTIDVQTLAAGVHRRPELLAEVRPRITQHGSPADRQAFAAAVAAAGEWPALLRTRLDELPAIAEELQRGAGGSWAVVDETLAAEVDWARTTSSTDFRRLVRVVALCGERMPKCSERLGQVLFVDGEPARWLEAEFAEVPLDLRQQFARVVLRFHDIELDPSGDNLERVDANQVLATLFVDGPSAGLTVRKVRRLLRGAKTSRAELDELFLAVSIERWQELIVESSPAVLGLLVRSELPRTADRVETATRRVETAARWIEAKQSQGLARLTTGLFRSRDGFPLLHELVSRELGERGDADAWATRALLRNEARIDTAKQVGRNLGELVALSVAAAPSAAPFIARADYAVSGSDQLELLRNAVRVQTAEALGRLVRVAPAAWPRLNERLIQFATDGAVTEELARQLCNAPLSGLRLFLVDHALSVAVLGSVRIEQFQVGRAVLDAQQSVKHFPSVAAGLTQRGRADLAELLAVAVGEGVVNGGITPARIGLPHLSHLLRLLPDDRQDLRVGAVENLGDADPWLRRSIKRLTPMDLAQSLYSLWRFGPEIATRLKDEPLEQQIALEIEHDADMSIEQLIAFVRLIGSISLLRPGSAKLPSWSERIPVRGLVRAAAGREVRLAPGDLQALLGLRALEAVGLAIQLKPDESLALVRFCREAQREGPVRVRRLAEELGTWAEGVQVVED